MVEELKLAIKIDDATIEQSLLKQFANAQKMADKVVLDFKNVNFDDKQIEAKFKEMQKKAGQNPIDLTIGGNTLDMLGQIDKRLTEIFSIGKGKSFIDSSSIATDIGKIENKINELNKKYEESQKKLSSIGSGDISGKDVNLVDNEEFKKLSQEVSELKNQFDDLKTHMQLLDDYTVPTDRFFELQSQVETTTVKVSDLVEEFAKLSNAQKALSSTPQESNISSASDSPSEASRNNNISDSIKKKKEALASYELQLEETRYEVEKLSKSENKVYGFNRSYDDKKVASLRDSVTKRLFGEYDPSSGKDGSKKWLALGRITNIDTSTLKSYQMWQEELQKVGYTLSEIKQTSMGLEADIIPIDGKAITNAEEFRKILDNISTTPTENVQLLNKQITELESKISSLKSEIASLESPASNQRKDAFPDKDVSVSVESATNSIKEENNVLEQNTQKVKENTQAKEQNVNANLNKYDKRLDSYNGKVDKYQATIDRFNDGGWTSKTYLENVQAVRDAVKQYATLLDNIKTNQNGIATDEDIQNLDKYEKKIKDTIATVTNMSAAEKGYNFVSGQKELDKIHKLLNENSKMSSEAKAKIRAYYAEIESGNPSMSLDKIHGEIMKIYNAEVEAGRAGRSFFDTLKNSGFHQLAAQMAGMFGFYDIINLGKEGLNVVRELNTALTEMRKVSDESLQSLKNYQNTTFDVADAVGTTAKQIQTSTADYMRLGESLDVAAESAKTANVLLNVSEFDNIEDATKSLVAMGQAYKDLDKMTIIDKLNEVGNNYAISTDELATALQKSSATLSLMGNTIDEAASLVTTANATIQDADSVSAGLRTISLRLVGTEEAEEELSAMNEEVDAFVKATNSKKQQIIKDYTAVASNNYQGFDILDSNGNYKNTYQILLGIAKVYKEIQEQDKKLGTNHATALIEELAGKNRSNIASAILQDPTQLEAVKKSSEEALGSAEKELNSYLDSIDGKMAQLENRAQEFWFKVIDSETIKNGIDLLSTLLKGTTDFVDTVGLLPTILTGIGAALSFKNVGGNKMHFPMNILDNIHNLLWIQRFRVCYP